MNVKIENAKMTLCAIADKFVNSKSYKAVEKVAITAGAGLITAGTMAMTSFAEGTGSASAGSGIDTLIISEINSGDILSNAKPFINAGIPIMAVLGGIRLGVRFLRGSMH